MADQRTSQTTLRLGALAASLIGAWLVHKIVDAVWQKAVGHSAPDSADESSSLGEMVVATALTGALVAVVRWLTQRATARAAEVIEAHQNGA
jgi:hypothetical protein